MISELSTRLGWRNPLSWLIAGAVLALAFFLGRQPSLRWLVLFAASGGVLVLFRAPRLGPLAVIAFALFFRLEVGTGTEVTLNPSTILVLASLVIWVIDMIRRGRFTIAPSKVNIPLMLFLLAGLFSLLIGSVSWDPAVPRSSRFVVVQLAQWGIFALSAGAFWLTATLGQDTVWLRRLFFFWLGVAAIGAVIFATGGRVPFLSRIPTVAVQRPAFRVLLAASAGGQLLFNNQLTRGWRLVLVAVLAAVAYAIFFQQRDMASNWIGVTAALSVLVWLRWPRFRWLAGVLLAILAITGILSSTIYDFAGGDDEWSESGGSRLVLIERVVKVTMRNPITGLGPAAYRPYARMEPLLYLGAFWVQPNISSHNNYVDLFSHVGLLGLGLFLWFAVGVIQLGLRLRARFTDGFEGGYVNGVLAAWAGSLVLMLFADWILPFVYNIGFPGFQASVLVWLFLGGLVALENTNTSQVPGVTTSG